MVNQYGFDGIVLEIPVVEQVVSLIQAIKRALSAKLLILVIQPTHLDEEHSRIYEIIAPLMDFVDRFSLNMYDYSTGPNAPTEWIQRLKTSIRASLPTMLTKVLMGIPFYGYDDREPIVGRQYLDLLRNEQPELKWDEKAEESYFTYQNGQKRVYYPSMRFLARRLEIAGSDFGGIAIWELGQGLDMFYDVL